MAIDLEAVRERLAALESDGRPRFLTVADVADAADAMENRPARTPSAYVAVGQESAEPNRTQGVHSQRVTEQVAVLFVLAAERRRQDQRDVVEDFRLAILYALAGWTAPGAGTAFDYVGFRVMRMADGLVWCECAFRASWHLRN